MAGGALASKVCSVVGEGVKAGLNDGSPGFARGMGESMANSIRDSYIEYRREQNEKNQGLGFGNK